VPRTGPQKSPLRPRCGLHPLDEGTATAYAAHYDTKAAIDYLKASGATAISVVAIRRRRWPRASVAFCSVDGVDLADWLVRNGLALDWPQYSKGRYDGAQRDAEHGGKGIWEGSYVEPWLFRTCIRSGGRPRDCSDANSHP
jgi:endonuclease YncB( thermonuclease family)